MTPLNEPLCKVPNDELCPKHRELRVQGAGHGPRLLTQSADCVEIPRAGQGG